MKAQNKMHIRQPAQTWQKSILITYTDNENPDQNAQPCHEKISAIIYTGNEGPDQPAIRKCPFEFYIIGTK